MKAVIDKYIPFLAEALRGLGVEVVELAPEEITCEAVADAEALFVRTRTRVDRALLQGSRVQFVATATIGTDHLDIPYLEQEGIAWASAPGCNAQAVCDYVEECLTTERPRFALNDRLTTERALYYPDSSYRRRDACVPSTAALNDRLTLGIVGCGHVGSKVRAMAERRGMRVLVSDPPKGLHTPLEQIAAEADVITFHTPLTRTGAYPTYHLCNAEFLGHCRPGTLIINAARGGVVDEEALLQSGLPCAIDTWEGEPDINRDLLQHAWLASYHIAGYSLEGKINASQQVLDAFCRFFQRKACIIDKKAVTLHARFGDSAPGWLQRITEQLKARPEAFEQLRKAYALR
ncbi:MAG: 4-phosphoerythronate dehydrogenase [Paludibacteraceae bacterium]